MKPSEKCKAAGLKSLSELSRISGESDQTLRNWSKNRPWIFDAAIYWAMVEKNTDAAIKIKRTELKSELKFDCMREGILLGDI